jgi:hypothetical protein
MKRWHYITFFTVAAAAVAFGFYAFLVTPGMRGVTEADTSHFRQGDVRIQLTEDAQISRGQDPVLIQLESGEIPDDVTFLTVMADSTCEADDEGVAHCLNPVEFETAEGVQRVELRHHHRFSEEPCLLPGSTLEIVR